jgi:hypothetical protein
VTLQPFSPDLAFRGNRDYLHGTTLFDVMIDELVRANITPKDLDFVFERRSDRKVMIVPGELSGSVAKIATLRYSGGVLTAVEREEQISRRQPYAESNLAKAFVSYGDAIKVEHLYDTYSFIDSVIYAFKTILQKREPDRKFVFARLRIPAIPEGAFSVTFKRKFGNQFYEGCIGVNGQDAGAIYFGAWS